MANETTSPQLNDLAKKYMSNIVGGLAGTAVGGGLGYATTQREHGESQEAYETRRRSNAISGLIAGGSFGAAAPSLYGMLPAELTLGGTREKPQTRGDRARTALGDLKNQVGDAADVIAPVVVASTPITVPTVVGATTGGVAGNLYGRIQDKLRDEAAKLPEAKVPKAKVPEAKVPKTKVPEVKVLPKTKTQHTLAGMKGGGALGLLLGSIMKLRADLADLQ